jgi:F0F1-type ATP synthase membrane subunit b/b'
MYILGLTSTQESLWWVTLGLALIVLLAVAAFLTVLVMLVRTIETRVNHIRSTLDQAATNTSDSALIAETADRVDAVLFEGLEHHLFLGRVLDKVRS